MPAAPGPDAETEQITEGETVTAPTTPTAPRSGYAPVNGLRMYYEIHGADRENGTVPVLLLHGAYMTTGDFGPLLQGLAATRRVVVCDQQGHGRTGDIDRPLSYEGMADDTAALLAHLGLHRADVVGYSMGGGVALQLVIRHPQFIRALVPISAGYRSDAMQPELLEMIPTITPAMFAGSPFEATYRAIAPDPDRFPVLVSKLKQLDETPFAWAADDIRGITAPTLIIVGDADAVRPEHAVEMLRLLGGGGMGDMTGVGRARLAILPGTTHFMPPGSGILDRSAWLLAMIPSFLDAIQDHSPSAGP
jgi:pimeloyl-ACP methyl ester carboxylesterase